MANIDQTFAAFARLDADGRKAVGLCVLPAKRTFDLCLFGERDIIVIEAKVCQAFGGATQGVRFAMVAAAVYLHPTARWNRVGLRIGHPAQAAAVSTEPRVWETTRVKLDAIVGTPHNATSETKGTPNGR
jgi:hypothetical protein